MRVYLDKYWGLWKCCNLYHKVPFVFVDVEWFKNDLYFLWSEYGFSDGFLFINLERLNKAIGDDIIVGDSPTFLLLKVDFIFTGEEQIDIHQTVGKFI